MAAHALLTETGLAARRRSASHKLSSFEPVLSPSAWRPREAFTPSGKRHCDEGKTHRPGWRGSDRLPACRNRLGSRVDVQAIVNGQFALGGNHPKVRASGAKGVCVTGRFAPSAEAAKLSKAPHFAKAAPVMARFSMGGSNPKISDKTKPVTRGFSMRFTDQSGDMVLVLISAPVFGSRTPQQLLESISVRLPGSDGRPDAEKIKAFVAANPETTRQAAWLNAHAVPASFAGVDYWAVHAYTLTNGRGRSHDFKAQVGGRRRPARPDRGRA